MVSKKTFILYIIGSSLVFVCTLLFLCYQLLDLAVSYSYSKQVADETEQKLSLTISIINHDYQGLDKDLVMDKIRRYPQIDQDSILSDEEEQEVYIGFLGFKFDGNQFSHIIE